MKIIPAIDIMDGQVVRLKKGDPAQKTVYGSDPMGTAKKWQEAGADMLHVVDLDATLGLGSNTDVVRGIASQAGITVQAAGGLRDEETAIRMAASAPRVVLGTLAFRDRRALGRLLGELGPERVVVSVDHIGGYIAVKGWQEKTTILLHDAMRDLTGMGITEFLLTDVGRDGMLKGPDMKSLEAACRFDANIIASGGISGIDDVRQVGRLGPYGVILGKALYDGRITVEEAIAAC